MTDRDVMKEISHILKREFPEDVVPTVVCTVDFIKGVYNLIDRYQGEVCYFEDLIDDINREKYDKIEYLSSRLRKEENKNSKLRNERNRLKAEIEDLKKSYEIYEESSGLKWAKAEAIKEFTERLKENFETYTDAEESNALYVRSLIDNLVKEMTEGSNEEVKCIECEHLMFSDMYGECSKGHRGIVRPDDSCMFGKRKVKGDE